jgi:hypothetical protein
MAKEQGLWNLFLPAVSGLNQTEYALIAEETGRFFIAPECLNCSAPGKKPKVTQWQLVHFVRELCNSKTVLR